MKEVNFKVFGGPLDGARGECSLIGEDKQVALILTRFVGNGNYVLDIATGKACHVFKFPSNILLMPSKLFA